MNTYENEFDQAVEESFPSIPGIYSPDRWARRTPSHVIGGINRAATAERDLQGRFLPHDQHKCAIWLLDPDHGVRGGRVRAATGKREKGRYSK